MMTAPALSPLSDVVRDLFVTAMSLFLVLGYFALTLGIPAFILWWVLRA